MPSKPSFLKIQTATAWGRTLAGFVDWIAPPPGWRALDVGSGPGLLPALLTRRGCRAFGLDLELIPRSERLHSDLVRADALHLPFPAEAFDLVAATNVLFLLPDPPAALQEMRRLLRPQGVLALINPSERMTTSVAEKLADERRLTGPNRASLLDWAARAEAHHRWNEAELEKMLRSAGLRILESALKIGPGLARQVKAVKE